MRVEGMSQAEMKAALGDVEVLKARLLQRLTSPSTPTVAEVPVAAVAPPTKTPALTIKQAAASLGVSPDTVRRMCLDGRLKHFKIGSRNIRIPESAVAKLEKGALQ